MKIFTKSLLTLALLCVAGVANADRSWQKVFTKGWCHEYRDGSSTQTDDEALTEDGAFKVHVLSREQMEAMKADVQDYSFQPWDSQFFITWDESLALSEGDKIKVKMKVKATTTTTVGTQTHANPGNYIIWHCIGDINLTDEWTDFEKEQEVQSDMASAEKQFYSIAFNLATGEEYDAYFKDIEVELYREKGVTKTVVSTKTVLAEQWISNGDIENENLANFPVSRNGGKGDDYPEEERDTNGAPFVPEIEEGPGLDGNITHYLKVVNDVNPAQTWGTQFFVYADKVIPKGTPYFLQMDIKADVESKITTGSHANPRAWFSGFVSEFNVTDEWQTFKWEGTIPAGDNDNFQSVAFDLNNDIESGAGNDGCAFYFDNIIFGRTKTVEKVENNEECIQVLFTAYTNMPDLILANVGNKTRQELPEDQWSNFKVTIDGADAPISSIEYDKTGILYFFLEVDDELTEDNKVVVSFTNPADEKFRLVYTNGDNVGKAVEAFEWESEFNDEIEAVPFAFGKPDIESADPEDKSFGIEASLNQFVVTFDKAVMGDKIEAKLDGSEKLNVALAEDGATATLTRTGTAALAEGEHTITINKVYAATDVQLTEAGSFTLTFTVGAKSMPENLLYAINAAKEEYQTSSEDPENRYVGETQTALNEAIAKYEAEGATYTAPSQVNAAIKDLSEKTEASKKHRTNCDTFDADMLSAEGILAENAAFAEHELYKALKAAYDKYAAMGTITDDAVLVEAVAALDENVAAGKLMFTSGESKLGTTGVAALVERIRSGKEALLALGASEDDEIIVAAKKAMTDDDALAKKIQDHLALKICEALKDEATAAAMFEESEVDEEGNLIPTTYDMTVFVKNPNLYKEGNGKSNLESVPGWTFPTESKPGVFGSGHADWGKPRNVVGLPEDCGFSAWHPNTMRMEQTVEGLPAGLYIVEVLATDWTGWNEGQSFAYAKTYSGANAALEVEEGAEPDMDLNYSATKLLEEAGNYQINKVHDCDPVEVIDGKLTLGVQFGKFPGEAALMEKYPEIESTQAASTQYMFEGVKLFIAGAIEGHDYAADYEQIKTGVNTAKTAKVRAIELYDLNGRRIQKTQKGLNIIKRVMSDGSIKTDKVVK